MAGSTPRGMRSASSMASSQSDPSPVEQAGDAGVGGVGDVQRARPTASTPPRCRRCRSTGRGVRSGSAMSRSMASLVADSLGATRMPWSRSTRHVPTVRRSCQPMPGPTGSPVARSHTMVEARWLAMPTPVDGPAGGEGGAGHLEHRRRPWPPASNSTNPGAGERRQHLRRSGRGRWRRRGRPRRRAPPRCPRRRRGRRSRPRRPRRRATAARACPGLRMPRGSRRLLEGHEHVEGAARGRRPGSGPG